MLLFFISPVPFPVFLESPELDYFLTAFFNL